MTKLSFTKFIILPGLLTLIIACSKGGKQVSETVKTEILPQDIVELRADQIKMANIELGSVEERSLGKILKANGVISVAPQDLATVCMPLGGFIKNSTLLPGFAVKKGQTLAVIENQDFVDIQQGYLEAKYKLVFAEAVFYRHTDLYKADVYSQQNLQQVTVEYKNVKATVKSLEQKLKVIGINPDLLNEDNISSTVNLVSPINGFLKTVNVNIGKYVSPTDVLFEIVNSEKLFLELTLFEMDADKAARGEKIKFFINNENEEHEAIMTQTGNSINNDKTFKAYAAVISPCRNLLPGMYVNAYIEETSNNVTALPSDAIVSFDDKDYIFTFEKEKEEAGKPFTEYRMIEVKRGITGNGYSEVRLPEGFNIKGAKIVIRGAYNLLSAKKNAGEMAC
jgi:cobalt-zinc-cadmium efflux system membrane fusion protein